MHSFRARVSTWGLPCEVEDSHGHGGQAVEPLGTRRKPIERGRRFRHRGGRERGTRGQSRLAGTRTVTSNLAHPADDARLGRGPVGARSPTLPPPGPRWGEVSDRGPRRDPVGARSPTAAPAGTAGLLRRPGAPTVNSRRSRRPAPDRGSYCRKPGAMPTPAWACRKTSKNAQMPTLAWAWQLRFPTLLKRKLLAVPNLGSHAPLLTAELARPSPVFLTPTLPPLDRIRLNTYHAAVYQRGRGPTRGAPALPG